MGDSTFTRKESIRLREFDYASSRIYFVTIVVRERKRLFVNSQFAGETIECLIRLRHRLSFNVYSYCLMPDHFHALIGPGNSGRALGEICGAFKSLTTRISWKWYEGKLWQRQYFDHIIRNEDDFLDCLRYIKNNPVKAELVEKAEDWPYTGRLDYLR